MILAVPHPWRLKISKTPVEMKLGMYNWGPGILKVLSDGLALAYIKINILGSNCTEMNHSDPLRPSCCLTIQCRP